MNTNTFKFFRDRVESLATADDFAENSGVLYGIDVRLFKTFINLMNFGAGLRQAKRALEELMKLSIETNMTEDELLNLSARFRLINSFIDAP